MTKKLNIEGLKELIIQVLEDYSLIMPYPNDDRLMAEPSSNESPPIMEGQRQDKIISILQALHPEELNSILKRFGYVKKSVLSKSISQNVLKNISDLTRASKGDL